MPSREYRPQKRKEAGGRVTIALRACVEKRSHLTKKVRGFYTNQAVTDCQVKGYIKDRLRFRTGATESRPYILT